MFKVASKVHIQSEPFSFCFEYNRESDTETGMGMITPFFLEHKQIPDGIRTRMTLYLAPTVDFDSLVKQFSDPDHLPDSILMFLSQINNLTIAIYDTVAPISQTNYSYRYEAELQRGVLTKVPLHGIAECISDSKVTYFHVTKKPFKTSRRTLHERIRPGQKWF